MQRAKVMTAKTFIQSFPQKIAGKNCPQIALVWSSSSNRKKYDDFPRITMSSKEYLKGVMKLEG
jgi:hypothetical protein